MVDVFISYSRVNQDLVRQLADAVTAEGYSVWWDAELPPHLSYGDVITEKIGSAKAAIVVWSQSAAASEWVRAEADVARGQKKLIQTSIDDVMPPMPFNQIQFASIGDWHGESDHPGWRKVKASLAALCGDPSEADAERREPVPPRRETIIPSTPATPPGRGPVIALLSLLVLLVGAGILILWMQGREEEREITNLILAESKTMPEEPLPVQTGPAATVPTPSSEPALEEVTPPEAGAVASEAASSTSVGEIIAGSDIRRLTRADIQGLSRRELFLARNEIFARHGRPFRNPVLQRHFAQFGWYRPHSGPVRLSTVEQANVALIAEAENSR